MPDPIILASSSEIRGQLLRNAGVDHHVTPARIDEDSIKRALEAEGAPPRDIADMLAEMKARKVDRNIYVPSFGKKGRSSALHAYPVQDLSLEKEKAGELRIARPGPKKKEK